MRKRVTLKDVAEASEVSISAASMALRDHPRISENKRLEIKKIALDLGYIYNRHAANLRKGTNDTVSICVNDLRNPVFTEFLSSVEREFRMRGKLVLLCNAREEDEIQTEFIRRMLEQGSAGLLLSPVIGTDATRLRNIVKNVFPTVLMSRTLDDPHFDHVVNDDALGIRIAVEELHRLGHRKIAWLGGGQPTVTARNRFEAYGKALRNLGLSITPEIIVRTPHTTLDAGRQSMLRILDAAPEVTGVICFGDLLALGAVSACRERGRCVGQDMSIIGHDDIEEAAYFEPALSTVRVRKDLIGQMAARMLLQRIDAPASPPRHKVIEPELVLRGTTGFAPRG